MICGDVVLFFVKGDIMRRSDMLLWASLCCFLPFTASAATKSFSFYCLTGVVRGDVVCREQQLHTYHFSIEVVSDSQGAKPENHGGLTSFIYAHPGERYAVLIHNPLPVRAAVNLSIDGLNTITGDPCTPSGGYKWLLEPNSTVRIAGWQVDSGSSRRFYFTSREDSYARWRSRQLGQDLTIKCGAISAAYFWNRRELEDYFASHPVCEYPGIPVPMAEGRERKAMGCEECDDRQAGTGMGERIGHAVSMVDFRYDMGMYRESEAVNIYYDFARIYDPPRDFPPYFAPEK